MMIKPEVVVRIITSEMEGVVSRSSWGETALFYNPGGKLPNGVYFCTIKEKDGANDKASNLSREGVYRLSIGTPKTRYEQLFGNVPSRPGKGGVVATGHDFSLLDTLLPHPVYAWMGWISVLSPGEDHFTRIFPWIGEAYEKAVIGFGKKTRS